MAHWMITLEREGAVIVVRGEGDDPNAPDRINPEIPGSAYRDLPDRIRGGVGYIRSTG